MLTPARLEWPTSEKADSQLRAGLRFGHKGTHTSRTMMLSELSELFAAVPADAGREDYATAVVEENVLGKQTVSNRRLTNQRLGELYGLDSRIAVFRVVRRLWDFDEPGRPLIALLCALARDPLLRASAPAVVGLSPGSELSRTAMLSTLTAATESRLNESILDKVARNAGSSWTQSGHLEGRVRKIRQRVEPSFGPVAFALWLGAIQGLAGEDLLKTPWAQVLDVSPARLLDLALKAKQLNLIHVVTGGSVVEIDAAMLDPAMERF